MPGQQKGSGSTAKVLIVALAAVVAIGVLAFAAITLTGSGSGDGSNEVEVGLAGQQPMGAAPSGEPDERWSERIECPEAEDALTGCSLTAGAGAVYVVEGDDDSSTLQAYGASDGKDLWDVDLDSYGYAWMVEDTVIARGEEAGSESSTSTLLALDPKTGKERWSEEFDVVSVVHIDLPGVVVLDTYDDSSETVVLDIDDGKERWSEDGSPIAQCGSSLILSDDGELTSVSASSGDVQWTADLSKDTRPYTAGCIDGGVVVIDDGELRAFSAGDGDERWSERIDDEYAVVGAVQDGQIILGGESHIAAFSAKDGSDTWEERVDGLSGESAADLYETDAGILLVGGGSATLFDASSGDEKASARVGDATVIALASNALLVGDGEDLSAYDVDSLDEKWSVDARDVGAIHADGASVYLITADELTAID